MADLFTQYGHIHGYLLTLAWFFLQNIMIWSQYFKYVPIAMYVHMGCAIFIALLHTAGTLMMLIAVQFKVQGLHKIPGFSVLLLLLFILGSGSFALHNKTTPHTSPTIVYITNRLHPLFGWLIIIGTKISFYLGTPYVKIFLPIDVASHLIYFIIKVFPNRPPLLIKESSCRAIKLKKDLDIYGSNYFIFANSVYSTDQLLSQHPGGWNIINSIRGREVDRFIYGVQPLEKYSEIKKRAHSSKSLKLAGQPIAVLSTPLTYRNMQQQNKVTIISMAKMSENCEIYILYLKSSSGNDLEDLGYEKVSQIGQFYALRAGNITRLYTAVNFLHKHNVAIMSKIDESLTNISSSRVLNESLKEDEKKQARNRIPLLVKKYKDGEFTSKYISPQNTENMVLSRNRGFGLNLHEKNMGNIVIFCGGTGIHPFYDLIDLVYKSILIDKKHKFSPTIKAYDSVLNTHPFEHFTFTFYIAAQQLEQIHPISLFQINKISKSNQNKCYLRIKNMGETRLKTEYPHLQMTDQRFERLIESEISNRNVSHIYLCGPTRMTKSMIEILEKREVSPQRYTIV